MTDQSSLQWRRMTAPDPWEAALLPTGTLPAELEEVPTWSAQVAKVEAALLSLNGINRQLLLQVWKLGPRHGAEILETNAGPWWPQAGLGVWPDREPPRSWNEAMLNDAMANALNQEEVRLASYKLLALKTAGEEQERAVELLRGHGALLQMFASDMFSEVQARGREIFLPLMVENRFRKARFFLPLLDCRTLETARDGEELGRWLCGARAYLRESAEDRGVMLIADQPLASLIPAADFAADAPK